MGRSISEEVRSVQAVPFAEGAFLRGIMVGENENTGYREESCLPVPRSDLNW